MFKVLHIVPTLLKGGPALQLFNLIKYLDRRQFLPQILTLSAEPKDSMEEDFKRLGVPISSLRLGRFSSFILARYRIRDYISKHTPNIVHSSGFRPDLFSARVDRTVHTVATVGDCPFEDYAYNFGWIGQHVIAPLHLKMLQKIEKPVIVSRMLSEKFSRERGISFNVIQNGVDQEEFFPATAARKQKIRAQLGLPLKHRLFAVIGRIIPLKDPLCVAEGFLRSAIPDTTMFFAGDGILREKLNRLCESGKIILAGRVTSVQTYLQASDFLVSGSHTEGMPNAVLEAMACGLPCILSDIRAHREMLDYQPQAGTLFPVGNAERLGEAIRWTINQSYQMQRQAALWIIENHLNAKRMSEQYQALYENLLRT